MCNKHGCPRGLRGQTSDLLSSDAWGRTPHRAFTLCSCSSVGQSASLMSLRSRDRDPPGV